MVPDAEFTSYYGRPVIKEPVWEPVDVPSYLFFGGLAGASSVLAAGSQLSGHRELARVAKVTALGAISLSAVALVHDLGRPSRFVNMLRVFKPSSPMSVGSWLLAAAAAAAPGAVPAGTRLRHRGLTSAFRNRALSPWRPGPPRRSPRAATCPAGRGW
jgi:hypothetical protein